MKDGRPSTELLGLEHTAIDDQNGECHIFPRAVTGMS